MPGVKGKSGGKATTAAAKAIKAKSGASRGSQATTTVSPGSDPCSADPVKRLGLPITWGDELKRRQVEGESIQNRRREVEVMRAQVELDRAKDEAMEARGKLVERVELDKTAALIRDSWWREAQRVTSDILSALPGIPVESRALIKAASDKAIISAGERVKASLQ